METSGYQYRIFMLHKNEGKMGNCIIRVQIVHVHYFLWILEWKDSRT